MKTILFILASVLLLFGCDNQNDNSPEIQYSTNAHAKWNILFFEDRFDSIEKSPHGILFSSKHADEKVEWKIAEKMEFPDHHSSRTVTLQKTDDLGAYFSYESSFNYYSFGKKLLQIDEGEFYLSWKNLKVSES